MLILMLSVFLPAQRTAWKGVGTEQEGRIPCYFPESDEDIIRNLKHYLNKQYRRGIDLSAIFKKKTRPGDNKKQVALDYLRGKKSVVLGDIVKVINRSSAFKHKHFFLIPFVNDKGDEISRYVMSDRGEVFANITAPPGEVLPKGMTDSDIRKFVKSRVELHGKNLRFKRVFYSVKGIADPPDWEAFDFNGTRYFISNPDKVSDKPKLYKTVKSTKWTTEARMLHYRNLRNKDSRTRYIVDQKNNRLLTLKEM